MADFGISSFFDRFTLLVLCALSTGCAATIHTDQHAIGWLGQDVRLPCDFSYPDDPVIALYWRNSSGITKASFVLGDQTSFDDRFTMNEDFSLGIRDVQVSDEGRYSCRLELDSGKGVMNHTELSIYASPSVPHIEKCANNPTGNEIFIRPRLCTVETSNTHPFNLDCRVTGFRPNVTVKWTSSGIEKQPIGEPFQRKLPDGTWEREVSISVTAKLDEEQNYTCTVRGEATNETAWSTTVTVLVPPMPTGIVPSGLSIGGQVVIGIVVILLIICILVVAILGVLVGLRRRRKLPPKGEKVLKHIPFLRTLYLPIPDPEEVRLDHLKKELTSLREKIRDYTFKKPDGSAMQSAHIGLFGEMSAGKSSFMNSLEFAFSGEFKQSQVIGALESGGGKTISRTLLKLTDSISLFDNRGMSDFQESNLEEITAQLRGERGPDIQHIKQCEQEEIHCAVFVFKISAFNRSAGMEFIEAFAKKLRKYNGYPPMIVITHAASSSVDENAIRNEFSTKHDINENVWFFENYTTENSIEDVEKSIRMLKFLEAAFEHCKLTVVHVDRRKRVTPVKPKENQQKRWISDMVEFASTSYETPRAENKKACVIS